MTMTKILRIDEMVKYSECDMEITNAWYCTKIVDELEKPVYFIICSKDEDYIDDFIKVWYQKPNGWARATSLYSYTSGWVNHRIYNADDLQELIDSVIDYGCIVKYRKDQESVEKELKSKHLIK